MVNEALVVIPTRGRPGNARKLLAQMQATVSKRVDACFYVDDDDPCLSEYQEVLGDGFIEVNPRHPMKLAGTVNHAFMSNAAAYRTIIFLGDDHMPRTIGWDHELIAALEGKSGVAYGDDLLQGENLPTAAAITTDLVTQLGYAIPLCLEHLYFDNFWRTLGQATQLIYLPQVIIEHMHYTNGKAVNDATYVEGNEPGVWSRDQTAWENFLANEWPREKEKLVWHR